MTQPDVLRHLLNAVAQGEVSPDTAFDKLKYLNYEPVEDFARVDHHRTLRTGFPEVIWGQGKTVDQIAQIMQAMRDRARADLTESAHPPIVMATRIEQTVYDQLREKIPNLHYHPLARICFLSGKNEPGDANPLLPSQAGTISVLSAGTADLPVAEEAALTATLCGFQVNRLWDVGVAGIHRLLNNRQAIADADVLIVVAGMEGALPSVVAGLAECPVIAVPTSVGYGANFSGLAPLLTMLNSCAAGVGVVNIDNGFGAAILAGQILRTASRLAARERS
ncbi:nickel pincer cofactor biosynthesis protein LarB [Leptothermofonsia sichuanensis E412]|uniref:nickel pincer cofactor biosynthesis protein LarB n=1 Tax=Leptothermofonsia sichuanensis TaxID=2917832 RepID=UPI001CA703F8|nr:nickel pincer cofactor biosynthesis protein LarB [Leptothermofonsia sichuanensis]QZZ22202.1 nickel pincer cofactor biosynthesis protein LarB [Leptothermofonsia sichuanensis E412]